MKAQKISVGHEPSEISFKLDRGLPAAARARGVTPAEWIASHLPQPIDATAEFDPATVDHLIGAFDSKIIIMEQFLKHITMCMGAVLWSGLDRVIYGTTVNDPGKGKTPLFQGYNPNEMETSCLFDCEVVEPIEEELTPGAAKHSDGNYCQG